MLHRKSVSRQIQRPAKESIFRRDFCILSPCSAPALSDGRSGCLQSEKYNLKERYMYGHELIEHLSAISEYNPEIKRERFNMINNIKNSIHFDMGDRMELIDMLYRPDHDEEELFRLNQNIGKNLPYNKMTLFFDNIDVDISKEGRATNRIAIYLEKKNNDLWFHDFFRFKHQGKNYWQHGLDVGQVLNVFDIDQEPYGYRYPIKNNSSFFVKTKVDPNNDEDFFWKVATLINFSLMLLNTKNITTIDNPPPAKLNKKRIKKGKQPLFTYKTLRLQLPAKKRKKGSGSAKTTDNTTRLHLCRGHFKTYTEDKPLMGKYTGRYWWQPHARGDKKQGVVMKEYAVDVATA